MTRPVVAGLDGSRESIAAADWAAREALRRGLPLRLVHAWEGLPDEGTEAALPELRAPQYHARRVLRTALEQLNERYPQLYIAAEQVRRQPGPALLAEAENAELLVIGSQGPSGVGGFFSGSVALATVAHVQQPVVLVRAGFTAADEHLPDSSGKPSVREPHRDVAVAVDTGGSCDEVLEFAFRAADLRDAPLRAVHAWHVPLGHGIPGDEEHARLRGAAEQELTALLQPWRDKYPSVLVREALYEGRPAHVLVRAANGAGLLVVGRRRRRAAVGSHTGPVAHALIHHVDRPVVLVPHD
ncbi:MULTISPECIES: universal stress protein [Streptomyces]|uniref:universal stress protein n=1 Tax=Streptomyces TaxID=1883 RepID=UPI000A3AA9D6|nr:MULTISPECIES: universal stress protein [Streptomyces]MDX3637085.1 universal stress protein [Streptomyces europaeiscabiei]MDX3655229.1 universal stress protein [Streptomyces europaeiscabiei]WRZ53670.1 universal stress protein [Streptomyces sp. NBC_01314]